MVRTISSWKGSCEARRWIIGRCATVVVKTGCGSERVVHKVARLSEARNLKAQWSVRCEEGVRWWWGTSRVDVMSRGFSKTDPEFLCCGGHRPESRATAGRKRSTTPLSRKSSSEAAKDDIPTATLARPRNTTSTSRRSQWQ